MLIAMRARRLVPMLCLLVAVAVGATGCFSSKVADTTVSGEVTVGQGTAATTVNPGGGGATTGETSTGETSTAQTSTAQTSTGESSTSETTTGGGGNADLAAGKSAFTATCGGCHTLKDAGTSGKVGPDLDGLAPLTADTVANQIEHGGGAMPPGLLKGKDQANVAAYVSSVAGK
jgi:cytochrome c551